MVRHADPLHPQTRMDFEIAEALVDAGADLDVANLVVLTARQLIAGIEDM